MLAHLSTTDRLLLVLAALLGSQQAMHSSSELVLLALLGVIALTPLVPHLVDAVLRILTGQPRGAWHRWSQAAWTDFAPPGSPGLPGMVLARAPARVLRNPA
ncbi:MAG TPA: hypothetical protein IAA98_14335 [Candidatus Avipropionibacterium avicola]|uniref:Uncharacterized protein n=1 Tax=Candidatus Avipropionibacterium avicola TaxID=2840701 RepID=A0A9D1H080_9ACTN|nr:hypothetical protein [Candidatus Avipropionibacterium avicola]